MWFRKIVNSCLQTLRAKVGQFYTDGVDYTMADGTAGSLRGFDSVVLAMGTRKYDPLSEAVAGAAPQVIVIGEALKSPGNAVVVTADAFEAAKAI